MLKGADVAGVCEAGEGLEELVVTGVGGLEVVEVVADGLDVAEVDGVAEGGECGGERGGGGWGVGGG